MAYVLTHATVLDGTEQMEPQPNMTVVVDDGGRIDRVGPAATTVGPKMQARKTGMKPVQK